MIINLGDAPFKAFITVTYPNGTCTVSLGNKSFTHSGGGTHTFTVNKKGTWTVTATSAGGSKESTTVNITERNQSVSVSLRCLLYLFQNGSGKQVGFSVDNGGLSMVADIDANRIYVSGAGLYSGNIAVYTSSPIDLTHYRTLHFDASAIQIIHTNYYCRMGANNSKPDPFATSFSYQRVISAASTTAPAIYSVDVSSASGLYYIGINGCFGASFYNIWLEP